MAIYGAGDAAIQVVNFLLLPLYVKGGYLAKQDYGALALIIGARSDRASVVSRWGLDGAFMRFYHERAADGRLPQLDQHDRLVPARRRSSSCSAPRIAAAGWIGARAVRRRAVCRRAAADAASTRC